MKPPQELQSRLRAVRSQYLASPWIDPGQDDAPLLRSWQRCMDAGMRPNECVNFELVSRGQLSELEDVHGQLVRQARPETERLAQALRGTGCAVMLFNPRGVVIDRLCHESATSNVLLVASRVGVNVSERCVGTTAPSIALHEGVANLVGRDAHFFDSVRPFFCVAAPIDSPRGERLAALDITSYDTVPGFDVMSLVVDAASAIENSLFQPSVDGIVVHFHPRAGLVGSPLEGLLQVDDLGTVTGANRMAARLLSRDRAALIGRSFSELFDRRLGPVFSGRFEAAGNLLEMRTAQGLQVMARLEGQPVRRSALGPAWPRLPIPETAARPEVLPPSPEPARPEQPSAQAALLAQGAQAPVSLRALEIQTIQNTLQALGGNVTAAARQLGVSRNTIYRRLQQTDPA